MQVENQLRLQIRRFWHVGLCGCTTANVAGLRREHLHCRGPEKVPTGAKVCIFTKKVGGTKIAVGKDLVYNFYVCIFLASFQMENGRNVTFVVELDKLISHLKVNMLMFQLQYKLN